LDWSIYREEQERKHHLHTEHSKSEASNNEQNEGARKSLDHWVDMLCHKYESTRLDAVKALEQADELAVFEALVKRIQDCDLSVRWAAMNILIAAGRKGLRPLLEALTQDFNSLCLRQSARHILQTLHQRGDLTSTEVQVLRVLETRTPPAQIARTANDALIASL